MIKFKFSITSPYWNYAKMPMDLTRPKKLFQNRDTTQFPGAGVLISLLPQVAEIIMMVKMFFIYMNY